MANSRRRGKSVVFDSLPSLVTADDDQMRLSRDRNKFGDKLSREVVKEIIMVLIGLVLVVWLFFGGSRSYSANKMGISVGSKQIIHSDSPYLVPAHFGSAGLSRDGLKKAPGDKQGLGGTVEGGTKRASNSIYQYQNSDSPKVVLVTVIDESKHPRDYIEKIIENRVEYAQAHGYGVLIKFSYEFNKFVDESHNHQSSWSRLALAMEAQVSFSDAEWMWYLSETALIMQGTTDIMKTVLVPEKLEPLMKRQIPIMRHQNVHIKTYKNNDVKDVSIIMTQDSETLNTDSFLFKNNPTSRSWLGLWAEPLYRSFERFNNERDALGHMMQWHTQFLVRTAVIDAPYLGSLVVKDSSNEEVWDEIGFKPTDMVAILNCDAPTENCKREFQMKWNSRVRVQKPANQPKEGLQGAKDQTQNKVQVQAQEKAQEKAEKHAQENAERQGAASDKQNNM